MKRPEAKGTGIYILIGEDPDKLGGEIAYIGEADDISKRIPQHARIEDAGGKDFWNRAIILTSKDTNLTKAHVRYLESRIITLAKQALRMALVNSTAPTPPPLPEADVSDMEYFLSQVRIILPVLGVNILRASGQQVVSQSHAEIVGNDRLSPVFELTLKKESILSNAKEIDGEFTVLAGSQARSSWIGVGKTYMNLRERLEDDGSLAKSINSDSFEFQRDVVFASPSAAAAVIVGRQANGRISWVDPLTGITYGEWQDQGLETEVDTEMEIVSS